MDNPFIFGKVVGGANFVDREEETSDIARTLLAGQNVICYSPRRYGKTSLMMQVKEILAKKGCQVFFIDLFRITSFEDLYNSYSTSIARAVRSPMKAILTAVQSLLPSINPKIVFTGEGAPSVEVSVPLPVLSQSATLRELFDSLETYCAKRKKKGAVIFDEFQEVSIMRDGRIVEREMRSAFQHHRHVSYAFLGSKHHLMRDVFTNKNRPFYNFGRHFELDVIASEHWQGFIAKKMGGLCSGAFAKKIIAVTESHPFYTQQYCHYLWDNARKSGKAVDHDALELVLRDILERDSMLFAEMWDGLSMPERHLLKALALEQTGEIFGKRFIISHNLETASAVQKASNRLYELDYIRKLPEGYIGFVNPFFKHWINRSAESLPAT